MISFPELLSVVEQQSDLLRSVSEMDIAVQTTIEALNNFDLLLRHSHQKKSESVDGLLGFIDKVLIPQLNSIRDSLQTSTDEPLQRLKQVRAQTERVVLRLRAFSEGAPDFLP